MTLIEFFDKTPIENLIASLALQPDRTIFVGADSRRVIRALPLYRRILENHDIHTDIWSKTVARNDIEGIIAALENIMSDASEDYVIDISGGDESSLVALGIILGTTDKNVAAFRIDPVTRQGIWFDPAFDDSGKRSVERALMDFSAGQVRLTIKENVALHGGKIYGESNLFGRGEPVVYDIDELWKHCCADPAGWNATINRFSASVEQSPDDANSFSIMPDVIGKRGGIDPELWRFITDRGFVIRESLKNDSQRQYFRYKNKQVRDCLTKAGSLFEYYVYKSALYSEIDGKPVFSDATTGITLGWNDDADTTRNEIDVMLMNGVMPVFISCKNGDIKTDELYKLTAVSERFGSAYAKYALAGTVFFDSSAKTYLGDSTVNNIRNRAADMNIKLIECAHNMKPGELQQAIIELIK